MRIRPTGIDTPERGECYYTEATEATRRLVGSQPVLLKRDMSKWDSWRRLLRHVYTQEGCWVNGALVREGYAWVTIYPPDDHYMARLYWLEAQAIAKNAGGMERVGGKT